MTSEKNPPRRRIILKTIAALILAFIAYRVIWWATGTPAPMVDYLAKIQELAASYQPAEGENGWPLLVEAAKMIEGLDSNEEVKKLLEERLEQFDWPPTGSLDFTYLRETPLVAHYCQPEYQTLEILRTQGAFDLLEQALAKPRIFRTLQYSPDDPQNTLYVLLPHLTNIRLLTIARVASMRLAFTESRTDEWLNAFAQSLGIARASGLQSSFVERLVGNSLTMMALIEFNAELLEQPVDREILNQLSEIMDRKINRLPMSLPLEWERMGGLDMIHWCFSDNGHGDGRLNAERFNDLGLMDVNSYSEATINRLEAWVHEGREKTTQRLQDFYDQMLEYVILSPLERKMNPFDDMALVDSFPDNQIFLRWMLVPLVRAVQDDDALETFVAGARLLISIKTYESSHGVYPESLDDLLPEILDQPILDPANHQPFIYRLINDRSGPSRVIVYSTGVDGVDDSANIDFSDPAAVDTIGYSVWEAGTDLLITRPRQQSTLVELTWKNRIDSE